MVFSDLLITHIIDRWVDRHKHIVHVLFVVNF